MSTCEFSRTCVGAVVPWVSGISALVAGILFLVECTAGQGVIKLENLPLGIVWARQGNMQLETRWAHWSQCHEISEVETSCLPKFFCLDRETIELSCQSAGAGPIAAGVFSYIAGLCLLPLPLGYLTATTKKHVIMMVSISGAAWLSGCISFSVSAASVLQFGQKWEDIIAAEQAEKDIKFESSWGSGLNTLLSAWIFSTLVLGPTVLWLVFWTPPVPSKSAARAERMWQNVPGAGWRQGPPAAMMYQQPQKPAAPLMMPQPQPYGSQPPYNNAQPVVMPQPYKGQPQSHGHWTAAGPRPEQKAPHATKIGEPASLRTSRKQMPNLHGPWSIGGNDKE